ncbi:MAG TPA: glucose-6-phosphate dehydrogenase assembly protein OpcA [Solirubrobacteraceae bacterium]|nr:glucose-6-phosphate dehydrogenase assembly protein OpcA [Solirubrobacteraceae bacterium]
MSEDRWSARDTTPSAIEAALRDLLARRYRAGRPFVPARVMNLVVIVERAFRGEVENRLARVGRYHPSRLILCAVEHGRRTLDAVATVAAPPGEPRAGELAVGRERVEIDMGPAHLGRLDTIVDALVVPDLTTMVWAPHGHDDGVEALRRLANIVLIDSQDLPDPAAAFARAEDLTRSAYVVDLAWLRSTPWRERVAATFDPPPLRRSLGEIDRVGVRHREDSAAAGALFCGWLASRLGWRPESLDRRGARLHGHSRARRHQVTIDLEAVELGAPGLAGVTIEMASGAAVTLERGPGGLRAQRRDPDGSERRWTVLGASRGEGGILGEGVRQALLRDPTYAPALRAARVMLA